MTSPYQLNGRSKCGFTLSSRSDEQLWGALLSEVAIMPEIRASGLSSYVVLRPLAVGYVVCYHGRNVGSASSPLLTVSTG